MSEWKVDECPSCGKKNLVLVADNRNLAECPECHQLFDFSDWMSSARGIGYRCHGPKVSGSQRD